MSRIFVSNLLQDGAVLIIGGVTILPGQTGVTVPVSGPITRIEVRPKNPASLMQILNIDGGGKFKDETGYEARRGSSADEVLLTPVVPDTVRFKKS